jgi:hypothetical protein
VLHASEASANKVLSASDAIANKVLLLPVIPGLVQRRCCCCPSFLGSRKRGAAALL